MSQTAVNQHADRDRLALPGLLATCAQALKAAQAFRDAAGQSVCALVASAGKVDPALLEREQYAAHGFAWLATYLAALEAMLGWAERLEAEGALRELERLLLQAVFGEYLRQLLGGIALSQVEVLRPADMGLDEATVARLRDDPAVAALIAAESARLRIAELLTQGLDSGDFGAAGLGD